MNSILMAIPIALTLNDPAAMAGRGTVVLTGSRALGAGALLAIGASKVQIIDPNIVFAERGGGGSGGAKPQKGLNGKGWRGDTKWKKAVKDIDQGGTIKSINNQVPKKQEAIDLIKEAGGKVQRVEGPHNPPNPHNFEHINYTTSTGKKGTIKIQPE